MKAGLTLKDALNSVLAWVTSVRTCPSIEASPPFASRGGHMVLLVSTRTEDELDARVAAAPEVKKR